MKLLTIIFVLVFGFVNLMFGCAENKNHTQDNSTSAVVPPISIDGEVFIATKGGQSYKLGLVQICAVSEEKINKWILYKKNAANAERLNVQKRIDLAQKDKILAESAQRAAQRNENKAQSVFEDDPLAEGTLEGTSRAREYSSQKSLVLSNKISELKKAQMALSYLTSPAYYLDGLKDCDEKTKTNADGKFSLTLSSRKYALAATASRVIMDETEYYYWLIWITPETHSKATLMLSNDNLMEANPDEKVVEIR